MAVVRIVSKEDYEVLKKYLTKDGESIVVLIPEEVAKATGTEDLDGNIIDYDCGSDAEIWIDIACHSEHYFFNQLKNNNED